MFERLEELVAPYLRLRFVAIAVGGVFLLLYLVLGARWLLSESSLSGLEEEVVQQRSIVTRAESRGEQVAEEYERLKDAIPPFSLQETDVFQSILAIAERHNINITTNFVGESEEQVENKTYRALTFQASVTGLRDGILDFFQEMDETQERIETLVVKDASISTQVRGALSMTFTVYTHTVE